MRSLILITFGLLMSNSGLHAQCYQGTSVLDGVALSSENQWKPPVPYPHLREADAAYVKRVWRKIDVRQKINHPFAFPRYPQPGRRSLFDALVCSIVHARELQAYDPGALGQSDSFTIELTPEECARKLSREVHTTTIDLVTGDEIDTTIIVAYETKDVVHYLIKEEWFMDKQRSQMDVRIIGLAPVVEVTDLTTGDFKGYQTLFWVYYPEARHHLAREEAFNPGNDFERRSFEELFAKRMFSSIIVRESNVYGRYVAEYRKGIAALLEAEAIQGRMTNYEIDMWHY